MSGLATGCYCTRCGRRVVDDHPPRTTASASSDREPPRRAPPHTRTIISWAVHVHAWNSRPPSVPARDPATCCLAGRTCRLTGRRPAHAPRPHSRHPKSASRCRSHRRPVSSEFERGQGQNDRTSEITTIATTRTPNAAAISRVHPGWRTRSSVGPDEPACTPPKTDRAASTSRSATMRFTPVLSANSGWNSPASSLVTFAWMPSAASTLRATSADDLFGNVSITTDDASFTVISSLVARVPA